MFRLFPIITLLLCLLVSCSDRETERVIDAAASLFEERPDSAYSLLKTIDADALPNGSELQARYALLFTQAQYKNYEDAANDSLISLAADYYEMNGSTEEKFYAYLYQGIVRYELGEYEKASYTLLKAKSLSESVENDYQKAQLYMYLSSINSQLHCSDEYTYAQLALGCYQHAGMEDYVTNALFKVSVAHLHAGRFDSCSHYLDLALDRAMESSDVASVINGLKIKANYALNVDSVELLKETYQILEDAGIESLTSNDLIHKAIICAKEGNLADMNQYIQDAFETANSSQEKNYAIACASKAYLHIGDWRNAITLQDSLLEIQYAEYDKAYKHAILAAERDYTEQQLRMENSNKRMWRFISLVSILLLVCLIFIIGLLVQKQKLARSVQEEKIKNLQQELLNHETEAKESLERLKASALILNLKEDTYQKHLSSSDWMQIQNLFAQFLPSFEIRLRFVRSNISETEWHICMLIKLGFTPSGMSILMSKSPAAISSIRSRLYQKVFLKKGSSSDWDDFIHSI